MLEQLNIPNKSLFKLDEVCTIISVKPYVLRFWENEFDEVNPHVSSTGQKLFENKDIQLLAQIKNLLFNKKLTIEKAKMVLRGQVKLEEKPEKKKASSRVANFNIDLEKLEGARTLLGEISLRTQSIQQDNNWI